LKKVSNLSDIAFLSIAAKNIVSLSPHDNSDFFDEPRIQFQVRLAKSAANFTSVSYCHGDLFFKEFASGRQAVIGYTI